MVIMATTLQVSKQSKEELLIIKAKLEQQTGEKNTLDDALKWLIAYSKSNSIQERIKASRKIFGCLSDLQISQEDLKGLRQERNSRF